MLLLDEIEKAHGYIFPNNILLQVMDHATLTDNNGRKADFPQRGHHHDHQRGPADLQKTSIGFNEQQAGR